MALEVLTPSITRNKPKAAAKGCTAASKKAVAEGASKPKKTQKRAKKAKTEDDDISLELLNSNKVDRTRAAGNIEVYVRAKALANLQNEASHDLP